MFSRILRIAVQDLNYSVSTLRFRLAHPRGDHLSRVLVNGSPKTGTTWMLKMIASIPGYTAVGNFNSEIQRFESVLPGSVVHGHHMYGDDLWAILGPIDFKVVLTIRDPRDQAVSRMFHVRRSDRHRWHARLVAMSEDDALMACITGRPDLPGVEAMLNMTNSWAAAGNKALIVKYEDLLSDPVIEFSRVLAYLAIADSRYLARAIVVRNQFERLTVGSRFWQLARKPGQADPSSHYRKGIMGDWKNYFNEAHKAKFKQLAGEQLLELGYEKDFYW